MPQHWNIGLVVVNVQQMRLLCMYRRDESAAVLTWEWAASGPKSVGFSLGPPSSAVAEYRLQTGLVLQLDAPP